MEEKSKRDLKRIREKALRNKEVKEGMLDGRMYTKVIKTKRDKNIDYFDEIYLEEELEEDIQEESEDIEISPWRRDFSEE